MGEVAINLKRALFEMNYSNSRMGFLHHNNINTKNSSAKSSNPTKTERKVIEKNRRNQMKSLYSHLNSLLPNHDSKEALPLPDQVDEAINYIKSLEEKVKKSKQMKESLTSKKRSYFDCSDSYEASSSSSKSPQLEIKEVGSSLQIVLISGLDNQFYFYEIIRILHHENVDIVSATYSDTGSSVLHVIHAQMRESDFSFGAARVSERLNRFINGSISEIELEPESWDFHDLQPETWAF